MADKEWQNAARAAWTKLPIWTPAEPDPAGAGDWFDQHVGIGPGPEQRARNRTEAMKGVKSVTPTSLASSSPFAALGLYVANKMVESGGEMPSAPKSATPVALPPSPAMRAVSAAPAGPQQQLSPLERILDNMRKADPKGGVTLGQLRALGSVFPGTAPATAGGGRAMSAADVAGLQLLAEADEQFNMDYAKAANQPTQELANQEYTKAIDRRKALREMLATKTQLDDAALAQRLGLGAVAE